MSSSDDEIKAGIRRLVTEQGRPVKFEERYYASDLGVSPYGWVDYNVDEHIHASRYGRDNAECQWVVPEGTVVRETTYSQFAGTFVSNENEVGLNAPGCHCACGKYVDVTLRVTSSLGEAIRAIIGYDPGTTLML